MICKENHGFDSCREQRFFLFSALVKTELTVQLFLKPFSVTDFKRGYDEGFNGRCIGRSSSNGETV